MINAHTRQRAIMQAMHHYRLVPITEILPNEVALELYPRRILGGKLPNYSALRSDIVDLTAQGKLTYVDYSCLAWFKGSLCRVPMRFYFRTGDPSA